MVKGSKVYSFGQLAQMIQASNNGIAKLEHNNIAHFVDNYRIGIRLYHTDIIIVSNDNNYELHSQGYTTATTKDRLNGFSPARVVQKDFTFYVLRNPEQRALKANLVPFFEGITVDRYGNINSVTA